MHFGLRGAQQAEQGRQFPRHGEDQVGKVVRHPVAHRDRRLAAARFGRSQDDRAASGPACAWAAWISRCSTPPPSSWVIRIADCRHFRPRSRHRSRSIRRRGSANGSRAEIVFDQRGISGVQLFDQCGRCAPARVPALAAERRAAEVADEQSGQRHVAPAQPAGAQAEIVLLAVSLGEHVGPEQSDGVQAVAPEVKTEADAHRNIDDGGRRSRVPPGDPVDWSPPGPASDWCRPVRGSSGCWRRSTAG